MIFLSSKKFFIAVFFTILFSLNLFAGQNNFEIAYEVSSYTYKEPHMDYPISLKSTKQGASVLLKNYGFAGQEKSFYLLELRYMTGANTYNGWLSGGGGVYTPLEASGIKDYYFEGALKAGKIFYEQNNFQVEGSVGLGYRWLKDNLQDIGNGGYLRQSQYFYVPFEADFKYNLTQYIKMTLKTELDWLISGEQYSGKIVGYTDSTSVNHTQEQGYGLRASLKFSSLVWGSMEFFVEPFWRYWHIQNSNEGYQYVQYGGTWYQQTTYEPFNTTQEYGVKVGLAF